MSMTSMRASVRQATTNWFVATIAACLVGMTACASLANGTGNLDAQLAELGFFDYASPDHAASVREAIRADGWSGIFTDDSRLFFADSEDLAEGGVQSFLSEVSDFLDGQGVRIDSVSSTYEYVAYRVRINGVEHVIWDESDVSRSDRDPGWLWGIASYRTLELVNRMLSDAGSSERAYGISGGNDFLVMFVTNPCSVPSRIIRTPWPSSRPMS